MGKMLYNICVSKTCSSGGTGRRNGLKIRYPHGCVGSSPTWSTKCRNGGIGRRSRLKICRSKEYAGSSPASGTIFNRKESYMKHKIACVILFVLIISVLTGCAGRPLESWMTERCSMIDMTYEVYPDEAYHEVSGALLNSLRTYVSPDEVEWIPSNGIEVNTLLSSLHVYHDPLISCCIPYTSSEKQAVSMFYISGAYATFQNIQSFADETIAFLHINRKTTIYKAVELLNDYLCDYFWYDHENLNRDYNVAIETGAAVCHVYSVLFQACCAKCGIQCAYIGDSSMSHAYNKIIFSDGTVRYIDVTWNDGKNRHKYFMLDYEQFAESHPNCEDKK